MANPIKTATGATLAIGTTLATPNGTEAEYAADSYTAVGELAEVPEFGDERSRVTFASLSDSRLRRARGISDAGETEITYAHLTGDGGQDALKAAYAASSQAADEFNFRIQLNDSLGVNPTTYYFRARVFSVKNKGLTNDGVVLIGSVLGINTEVLEVEAA